ncbi:MAG: DNA recombination protein RmuC [Pseudoxanthomonas sp.]
MTAAALLTNSIAIIAALALVALGWLLGRRANRGALDAASADLETERQRAERLAADAARLPDAVERAQRAETTLAGTGAELQAALAREAGMISTMATLRDAAVRLDADAQAQRSAQSEAQARLQALGAELATATAQRDAAQAASTEARTFLAEAQAQLRIAFTAAASEVFDGKARVLNDQIKASGVEATGRLQETLKPFAERVETLQARIEILAASDNQERAKLVGTIAELKTLNQDMADATTSLSRALKGGAKVRGQWGEMILETVLKASGLVEDINFTTQKKSHDDETGQRRFADVVVNMPDGRAVVIDSKVNLVDWANANDADTPEALQESLNRHAAAMRMHMRELADKNYPKTLGPHALEITVMFVPIEGALSAALAQNGDLQVEAFANRVVFASPNTLMAMLQVVSRLWTRDKLQKQLSVIGAEAGKLIDSIGALLEEFDDIGTSINRSDAAYRKARNRLTDSPQSVLARAKRLVEAGAKGKRALPDDLQPSAGDDVLALGADPQADAGD